VSIGGDYEIGRSLRVSVVRSVRPCVLLCVCVTHDDWAGTVAPSCENFYIGGDMHSHERLLVCFVCFLIDAGIIVFIGH